MIKVFRRHILIALAGFMLSACQVTQQTTDRLKIKQAATFPENNVQIYCEGAENCEFQRLNKVVIVNDQTKRVNPEAIQKGWVRLTGHMLTDSGLYLTVPAQQHEMVIRFYPISEQHAEVFHVIHAFKANQRYHFKMYRKRKIGAGSLFNVSAPSPLCVDLLQEQRPIRRFCRPYNVMTGMGEFVEQRIYY